MNSGNFETDQDYVADILYRARTMLDWAIELHLMYGSRLSIAPDKRVFMNRGVAKLTVIQINLYFSDALLCVHTLITGKSDGYKAEMSLPYMWSKYGKEIEEKNKYFNEHLKLIQKIYTESKLDIIRSKIVAHKDSKTSGSALGNFMNRFKEEYHYSLSGIVAMIEQLIKTSWEAPANNYFQEFYADSYGYIKSHIDTSL